MLSMVTGDTNSYFFTAAITYARDLKTVWIIQHLTQ